MNAQLNKSVFSSWQNTNIQEQEEPNQTGQQPNKDCDVPFNGVSMTFL